MNWLEESVKRSKKLKDHFMLKGIDIYIKDQLPQEIDIDFVIQYVAKRLPDHVLTNIDIIFPNLLLKNTLFSTFGNLFTINLCIAKYAPCSIPQTTKFHEAPCHNPPKNITIARFEYVLTSDFLLPPSGIYR